MADGHAGFAFRRKALLVVLKLLNAVSTLLCALVLPGWLRSVLSAAPIFDHSERKAFTWGLYRAPAAVCKADSSLWIAVRSVLSSLLVAVAGLKRVRRVSEVRRADMSWQNFAEAFGVAVDVAGGTAEADADGCVEPLAELQAAASATPAAATAACHQGTRLDPCCVRPAGVWRSAGGRDLCCRSWAIRSYLPSSFQSCNDI